MADKRQFTLFSIEGDIATYSSPIPGVTPIEGEESGLSQLELSIPIDYIHHLAGIRPTFPPHLYVTISEVPQ